MQTSDNNPRTRRVSTSIPILSLHILRRKFCVRSDSGAIRAAVASAVQGEEPTPAERDAADVEIARNERARKLFRLEMKQERKRVARLRARLAETPAQAETLAQAETQAQAEVQAEVQAEAIEQS